jgi:DNA polymerase-3 subunit epsilon
MTRQIVLDTETTGISHEQGHRIIEIGCVELINRKLTGKHYHVYINPEREIDAGAFKVHGISLEFLSDKPVFKTIMSEFLEFIEDSELIIHNAVFDLGFLNAELKLNKKNLKLESMCSVIDTLVLARKKHPGQKNNLDALCKRYFVDNTNRQLHGALLDAEILARVYLAMTGGQISLFGEEETVHSEVQETVGQRLEIDSRAFSVLTANAEELAEHEAFLAKLTKKSGISHWE